MIEKELKALGATFKIEKTSGEGGSASVYKAYRLDSNGHSRQTVALKILKNKNAIPWLRKEFETLTQIRSVHCARVYAWETLDLGPALMLEWIDGVTLFELARSSVFDPKLLVEVVSQIEAGLQELSASGLHHGDLSPKNILVDRTGLVRLVDFATPSSNPGEIVGTPAYLSPEIWQGLGTSLDSDLFALELIYRDAARAFRNVPSNVDECRSRAFDYASRRHESPVHSSSSLSSLALREQLARVVSGLLDAKTSMCEATSALGEVANVKRPSLNFGRAASLLATVAFGSTIVSARAQAPIPTTDLQVAASLKIASNRWIFVRLNGRDVGYAPIHLKNLRPGRHRLAWKTSTGQSETRIWLESGQRLTLKEADLSRLE